jgi:hypothetical protein
MNTTQEIFQSIYGIAVLLSFLPAMWISGKIILSNITEEQSPEAEPSQGIHRIHILYWIVLAGLFSLPITDLLRLSYTLLQPVVPGYFAPTNQIVTFWGSGPMYVFDALQFALILLVYALVLSQVRGLEETIDLPYLGVIQLTGFQRVCLMLGIGGLVNQLAEGVVSHIVWLNIPLIQRQISAGLVGILGSWVVGILLLILIYLALSSRLYSSEDEGLTQ